MRRANEIQPNPQDPDDKPLTKEQLERVTHALKISMLSTAEAFYNYMRDPDTVSSGMRGLFDQYLPTDKSFKRNKRLWCEMDALFKFMEPEELKDMLGALRAGFDQDPTFRTYYNHTRGYSIIFPSPVKPGPDSGVYEHFKHSVLQLFIHTRLQQAAYRYQQHFIDGDGTPARCYKPGKECDFIEFETEKGLCYFMNQCNPGPLSYSPRTLRIARQ